MTRSVAGGGSTGDDGGREDEDMPRAESTVGRHDSLRRLISAAHVRLPSITERITADIQATVPSLAGPADGRRHQMIHVAISSSAEHFLKSAAGTGNGAARVEDLCRTVGFRHGAAGQNLHTLTSAIRIASRACWDELRVVAADNDVPPSELEGLGNALSTYVEHLTTQVQIGFDNGSRARAKDNGVARSRLHTALLTGADREEMGLQATIADWPLPGRLVVIVIELGEAELDVASFGPRVLGRAGEQRAVLLCDQGEQDATVNAARRHAPDARIALSWPVQCHEVPAAYRWAERALELVARKVIAARPIIDCREHRTILWLHAEPILRQHLAQDLLQPLFTENRNSREILSETLLVWLETRGSAPAIAAKLGVHPQTVRYRWRRINELFGDSLHDPEFVVQLTMLLKASVPLWLAGDQSDFERYAEQGVA